MNMWIGGGALVLLLWTAAVEVPALWRARRKKELALLSLIVLVSCTGGVLQLYEYHLPNPLSGIASFIGPYARAVYALFG